MSKFDFISSPKEESLSKEALDSRERIRQSLSILKERHQKRAAIKENQPQDLAQEEFFVDNDVIHLPIEMLSDEELDLWQEVVLVDSKEKMDAVSVKYQDYKKKLFNTKNPPGIEDPRGIFNSLVGNYLNVLYIYFRLKKSSEEIEKFRRNYQT